LGHGEAVGVVWLYSAIVLRFDVLRILLEQKLQMDVSATRLFEQSTTNFADGYNKY